jgi:hypothetical protein
VTVRIILRLSNCSESALKFHLPRLDVRLDAYAVNPADSGSEGSGPTKDLIFSGAVNDKEDPLVVVDVFEEDEESGNHVYVTWKVESYLSESSAKLFLQFRSLTMRRSTPGSYPTSLRCVHSLSNPKPSGESRSNISAG